MKHVEVQAAIAEGQAQQARELAELAERLVEERRRLAFADPSRTYAADGRLLQPNELPADVAAAITAIEVHPDGRVKRYVLGQKAPHLQALEKRAGLDQKAINFPLPPLDGAASCAQAQGAVAQGVANGALLPSEGQVLSGLIEAQRRALETSALEARLAALEAALSEK